VTQPTTSLTVRPGRAYNSIPTETRAAAAVLRANGWTLRRTASVLGVSADGLSGCEIRGDLPRPGQQLDQPSSPSGRA
jgi:hypothetical protein